MKILVTGKNGQLGWELLRKFNENQKSEKKIAITIEALFLDSQELDIRESDKVDSIFSAFQPDIVINAAAYTAVDKAESDTELAYAVNEAGVENLAQGCKVFGAKLIHVSTDFVFAADKNTPYKPEDQTAPLNVYGASKLAGELSARDILGNDICIVRTSWVYSVHGNNFVKTMIRLMSEKEKLGVVADQIGTPTSAYLLAEALWKLIIVIASKQKVSPIYHWTDLGTTTWYDFAVAIQDLAVEQGILTKAIPIKPISTIEYPTPAKRPAYSVMDTSSFRNVLEMPGVHWRKALSSMIRELAKQ